MSDLRWLDAIKLTLEKSGAAMHYTEIAEAIVESGLRKQVGVIPAATVNSQISMSIKEEGADSPFVRVSRGEYILRKFLTQSETLLKNEYIETSDELSSEEPAGLIQAMGMFWQRDLVLWTPKPALCGCQQIGADPVDFSGQKGVYLLYDGREVIYVGRSVDRPLGKRLYEHTQDRLRSRWDRFSWFGLLSVTDSGQLQSIELKSDLAGWVATLEAVLIESLEPRQNRKRGDDFTAIEYLQTEDPEIQRRNKQKLLAEIQSSLGL